MTYYAEEAEKLFKISSTILYNPGTKEGSKGVGPTGMFVSRINTLRDVITQAGLRHKRETKKPELIEIAGNILVKKKRKKNLNTV